MKGKNIPLHIIEQKAHSLKPGTQIIHFKQRRISLMCSPLLWDMLCQYTSAEACTELLSPQKNFFKQTLVRILDRNSFIKNNNNNFKKGERKKMANIIRSRFLPDALCSYVR